MLGASSSSALAPTTTTTKKKRERSESGEEHPLFRYEDELRRCRRSPVKQASKRPIDEPGLMAALKRTRISCAPGELRMKNDVAALERSELVKVGRVDVASLGSNALVLAIENDERYLITVTQRYPFERPTVRNVRTSDETELRLLDEWSAVYSLVDVANALFERSQVRDLFRFELARKPPIFSAIARPPRGSSTQNFNPIGRVVDAANGSRGAVALMMMTTMPPPPATSSPPSSDLDFDDDDDDFQPDENKPQTAAIVPDDPPDGIHHHGHRIDDGAHDPLDAASGVVAVVPNDMII
eukprot:CAMPEP_0118891132 /NCGR_PEP_ID=MMETSP1166-20130328/1279_1 /TAXON_ID=1104430 /ORGANISM="Chrysoreinhardia sp, Strain CCMP3193" /LENGTH=297 /DNA_ID=CAMNT_0006829775 /DNA_START=196 /DNA_END=1089 /DNA_ORIENTATION=+